ncbi:dTDP-4-dehydrorhamnose reductase [Mariniflexile sp. HNIBRBA6329]|uniref:dTDP-4-dehydrorhamnose reductase n=1 Tax=Mariniflexile sp. HNIBRBA6329 TaxID=3373088 RepID=UPI003746B5FB
MRTVLVTGSNGQLGNCIKDIESNNLNIIYTDYLELDISDLDKVKSFFKSHGPIDYCVNCAAYTAVDNAEKEPEKAYQINALGPKNLALTCELNSTVLIQVSTDFVFDGEKTEPYKETDLPNPLSVYGKTKWKGENFIQQICSKHIIIRTSWLYSPFGNNFVKTMLRLAETNMKLNIVNDQIGTPTNAYDLAGVILHIIGKDSYMQKNGESIPFYGTYHYSNEGICSWFDFAKKIFEINNIKIELQPIPTINYPTPAKRPHYSVLDKAKIKRTFGLEIKNWEETLKKY